MRFFVNAELGRIAMRQGIELPFVVWSILRGSALSQNLSSHFTKADAIAIVAKHGLRFTARHWSRIWASGQPIFWGIENKKIYLRSIRRVAWRFEGFIKPVDLQEKPRSISVEIELSGGMENLRAELYRAWFLQFEQKTISRATLKDLFGLSPEQQRSYEKALGSRFLVKTNYAHIEATTYQESPKSLPTHNFTIKYEREARNEFMEYETVTVAAIQYQLPNSFMARSGGHCESHEARTSNSAILAARTLFRHTDSLNQTKRTFWLKWNEFEALGSMDSYVKVASQGKKRLWLSGHYL